MKVEDGAGRRLGHMNFREVGQMLVMIVGDRLVPVQQVCQNCVMASRDGQPRWDSGQLRCGQAIVSSKPQQPDQFDCEMGFRVVQVS